MVIANCWILLWEWPINKIDRTFECNKIFLYQISHFFLVWLHFFFVSQICTFEQKKIKCNYDKISTNRKKSDVPDLFFFFQALLVQPGLDGVSSTDSVGTHSDVSGNTTISGRPRMDVACVLDLQQPEHIAQRKRALEEVVQACNLVNSDMHHIQVRNSPVCRYSSK